jgi:hypothetical protein
MAIQTATAGSANPGPPRYRRSDYDVTNTVQVSSVSATRQAVESLYVNQWPEASFQPIDAAFEFIEQLFAGEIPGYLGIDTVYHDRQHTLDNVLAMARLLVAWEKSRPMEWRLGADRAAMGIITSLFHDAGYVRETGESVQNGAELTRTHVSRSARILSRFLPTVGMDHWVDIATQVVHYTGYEVPLERIQTADPRDRKIGHLLGTADLLAQFSDRCYLEKCRDRLYPEFVLAGMAHGRSPDGRVVVHYASGLDLLRRTPMFVSATRRERLEGSFEGSYHLMEVLYAGRNPYIEAIDGMMLFLQQVLRTGNWPLLRRQPPVFTRDPNPMPEVRSLMVRKLKDVWNA